MAILVRKYWNLFENVWAIRNDILHHAGAKKASVPTVSMNCLNREGGKNLTYEKSTWYNKSYSDVQGWLRSKKADKADLPSNAQS